MQHFVIVLAVVVACLAPLTAMAHVVMWCETSVHSDGSCYTICGSHWPDARETRCYSSITIACNPYEETCYAVLTPPPTVPLCSEFVPRALDPPGPETLEP